MNDSTVTRAELIRWSEALAGIARTGLGFSQVQYERERYEEILHVAIYTTTGNTFRARLGPTLKESFIAETRRIRGLPRQATE